VDRRVRQVLVERAGDGTTDAAGGEDA
jgi:hypothetical protein